jgi:phospholipid transport system substrate-binding protein
MHVPAQAVSDPVEQLRPVVDRITTLLTEADFKKLPREEQFTKFLNLAAERFDFNEMSKRVLGPRWNSLSDEQKQLFIDRFSHLLGYTYMDRIDTYDGEPIQYEQSRIRGDRAEVRTIIEFKDGDIPISYIMQLRDAEWMAYDLIVENISLVRNYMEQLRSILQRNGFDGLIQQINSKIAQLQATKK